MATKEELKQKFVEGAILTEQDFHDLIDVAGSKGDKGNPGDKGDPGDDGFPSEAEWNDLVARVDALEE